MTSPTRRAAPSPTSSSERVHAVQPLLGTPLVVILAVGVEMACSASLVTRRSGSCKRPVRARSIGWRC
jgi:hypothetical protein